MAMSPLEVIKKFMASLDTTTKSGEKALDEAIAACSNFKSAKEVIAQMLEDQKKSKSADDFLKNYCGIDLDNNDTGAITGKDAGGSTKEKTAESIVPEGTVDKTFKKNQFEINGLTVKLGAREKETNSNNYKTKSNGSYLDPYEINFDDLNEKQQYIWQQLHSNWIREALKLITDSYGENMSFDKKKSSAVTNTIWIIFDDTDEMANSDDTATTYGGPAYSKESTNDLKLHINFTYYGNIDTSDQNGKTTDKDFTSSDYLDRTIAHELTHAVMRANINYYDDIPSFIKEGVAEITHGRDGKKDKILKSLAANSSLLEDYLNIEASSDEGSYTYSAGYMFMRYLAKNAESAPLNTENYTSKTIISGTDLNDTVRNYAATVTITGGAGKDSLYNSANNAKIDGGNDADRIVNGGGNNVSINGGAGNDSLYNDKGTRATIEGGAGADYISNWDSYAKIFGGDGDDLIYHNEGTNATVDAGAGNDSVKNWDDQTSIFGGAGNDSIYNLGGKNSTITGATGNDYITLSSSSKNNLIFYNSGDGNDTIIGISATDTIKIVGGTYEKVTTSSSTDATLKVGTNSILVKGGKNIAFKIDGTIKPVDTTITNSTINSLVSGTPNADTIKNIAGGVTIRGGAGNDYIKSSTEKPHTVKSSYGYVTIDGGDGNDTIDNNDPYVSINGGAGVDYISVGSYNNVTVTGGKGNDTIYGNTSGYGVVYQYANGDGNDIIYNFSDKDTLKISGATASTLTNANSKETTIKVGSGSIILKDYKKTTSNNISLTSAANTYTVTESGKIIYALSGNDKIKNTYTNVTIYGGTGNDSILNQQRNVLIYGENDNDTILNTSTNVSIYGGAGNDSIRNDSASTSATIHGDAGNDIILSNGSNTWIYGDAGADKISLGSYSQKSTVNGGKDNDSIYSNNLSNVIQYANGDGKDTIYGFGESDTLHITNGSISKITLSGGDVIFTVGSGNLTLKEVKSKKIQYKVGSGAVKETILGGSGGDPLPSGWKYGTSSKTNTTATIITASISSAATAVDLTQSYGKNVLKADGSKVTKALTMTGNTSNNTLTGGKAADTIYGGAGADLISGGNGNDFLYGDDGNDKISGGSGIDFLSGGNGDDSLNDGAGNDFLVGGSGKNTLTGGAGKDKFYITSGQNYITDYKSGEDTLNILDASVDSYSFSNKDLILKISTGSTATIKGGKGQKLTFADSNSKTTTKTYSKTLDLMYDDKFVTDEFELDDITEEKIDVTEIQTTKTKTFAQDENILTFADDK